MQLRWLSLVLIGLLMLYLSFFGSSGIGLTLSGPSIARYDFDSLYGLNPSQNATINPAGQLQLAYTWPSSEQKIYDPNSYAGLTHFTYEVKILFDTVSQYQLQIVLQTYVYPPGIYKVCSVAFSLATIGVTDAFGNKLYFSIPNHEVGVWYTYTVVVNYDTGVYDVYREFDKVCSGTVQNTVTRTNFMSIGLTAYNTNAMCHIDYLYISSGLSPPIAPSILTITSTVGGTTDPAPGTYTYTSPRNVEITAINNVGYSFDHWEYDNPQTWETTNPVTLTMNINHNLKAYFLPDYTVELSVYCDTEGTALSATVQIDSNYVTLPASPSFQAGTIHSVNMLTLQDNAGHKFLGWDQNTNADPYLSVSGAGSHVAHFKATAPPPPPPHAQITVLTKIYNGVGWVSQANVKINSYNLTADLQRICLFETNYSNSAGFYVFNYSGGAYEFEGEWNGIKNSTKLSCGNEPCIIVLRIGVSGEAPFDFWQYLKDIISQYKDSLMYGGIGLTGLGSVLFIIPRKKR